MNRQIKILLFVATLCVLSCHKKQTKQPFTPLKKSEKKESRKSEKLKLHPIEITIENIKSRDSVIIKNRRYLTSKTAIFTTFADSMEISKEVIFNKKPTTKKLTYLINKKDFINLTLDVSLEKYNFFLEAGDKLHLKLNEDGFLSDSKLNNNSNHPALLLSKNAIPIKSIAYLKYMKAHNFRVNDKIFEREYKKTLDTKLKTLAIHLEETKPLLSKKIHYAIKKHLELLNLKNDFSIGNEPNIKLNDSCMSIATYRSLSYEMLQKINDISYLDNEKKGINKAFKTVNILMNDNDYKKTPKTSLLILRELLDLTGSYEPNFIPELIEIIPNKNIKSQYLATYTKNYILELKDKRNDTKNLNLIASSEPKKVFTFNDFLNQNKGKIIYLDIWASWCGPCKKQLKNSFKLKKQLSHLPITFAYFSIDKSFSKWKTASIEEEIGENPNSFLFFNTKNSIRYLSWKVQGIPRYLIFDKQGKLVNKNAPFPNTPEIKKILLKHLHKK